jgi:hypothetical protein
VVDSGIGGRVSVYLRLVQVHMWHGYVRMVLNYRSTVPNCQEAGERQWSINPNSVGLAQSVERTTVSCTKVQD